jgi:hypothetical protein
LLAGDGATSSISSINIPLFGLPAVAVAAVDADAANDTGTDIGTTRALLVLLDLVLLVLFVLSSRLVVVVVVVCAGTGAAPREVILDVDIVPDNDEVGIDDDDDLFVAVLLLEVVLAAVLPSSCCCWCCLAISADTRSHIGL